MRKIFIIGAIAAPVLIGSLILGIYFGTQPSQAPDPAAVSDQRQVANAIDGKERQAPQPRATKAHTPISQQTQATGSKVTSGTRPNILMLVADDTGYADFWTFGNPEQEINEVDAMARDGMTFTHWTAGDRVCSPSRAAFLTGQYPVRNGVYGYNVVFPADSTGGLPDEAITIAEALKDQGYATGFVGKWHLGVNQNTNTDGVHLPIHHGFDFVGTHMPYTQNAACHGNSVEDQWRYCYLYNDDKIIEQPANLTTVTQRMLDDTKSFITQHKDQPWFYYYSFLETHQAMFCDDRFCGKSKMGAYGDDVNEMAWALGETLQLLKDLGIDNNTLQIFVSDNGPLDFNCHDEGNAGMFRGGKGTTWEGGLRVPAIARWPGTIPPNTFSHNLVNTMDIFPTAMYLAGDPSYMSDKGIALDGQLIPDILQDYSIPVRDYYFYYCSDRLMAVRYQQYKIHYATIGEMNTKITNPATDPNCQGEIPPSLMDCHGDNAILWNPPLVFNILSDPGETMIVDTSSAEMQDMLNTVNELALQQYNSVEYRASELQKEGGDAIIPCCNPPSCQCNYTVT